MSAYYNPIKLLNSKKSEFERLLKFSAIRKSQGEYPSVAFPILKSNRGIHLVVEYLMLNKIMINNLYRFPRVTDEFYSLKGQVFS